MQALRWIHGPDDWSQLGAAQKRFRFEEALVLQLVLARRRAAHRAQGARARAPVGATGSWPPSTPGCRSSSPADSARSAQVVAGELARDHPMNRLLQGEVGSGKTLVALRAMLQVVDSGGQAALLAPTEVLAQQHHRSISAMLGDLAQGGMLGGAAEATSVVLLTGSMGRGGPPGGDAAHRHRRGRASSSAPTRCSRTTSSSPTSASSSSTSSTASAWSNGPR